MEAHEYYTMEFQEDMPQLQDLECIYTSLELFPVLHHKEAFHDEDLFADKDRLYLRAQRVPGSRANSAMQYPFEFPAVGETLRIDQAWFEEFASAEVPEGRQREFLQSDFNESVMHRTASTSSSSRNTRSKQANRQP
jgi:hypothetical protein